MRIDRSNPQTIRARLAVRPEPRRSRPWLALGAVATALAGLAGLAFARSSGEGRPQIVLDLTQLVSRPAARPTANCAPRPQALQSELSAIAAGFDGKIGIAVRQVGCDWVVGERLGEFFPQQSVSKLWVALAAFDAVDAGRLRLDQQLTITPNDLTLFNQPLRAAVLEQGMIQRPVLDLLKGAMSLSDNTANDRLLWTLGGPDRIRALLRRHRIEGIRFGPGERLLQSKAAGLTWQPELAIGRNFEQARAQLPMEQRQAALAQYLANPPDGATPAGMTQALARLAGGELLSPASTRHLLEIMGQSRSGPMRLKGGLPPDWQAYHKTGTGQELRGVATGYNDVAVIRAPDGTLYAVAALIGSSRAPIKLRMETMQAVSAAVARHHTGATTGRAATSAA